MEWNAMHAPLRPPPGYEDMLTVRSVLPGLASVEQIQSPAHFMTVLRAAWKLYRHQWVPDADIVAEEKAAAEKAAELQRIGEERRRRQQQKAAAEAGQVAAIAYDALPDSKETLQDRLDVLNYSLEQFMVGFAETSTGATTLFGSRPYRDVLVHPANAPVVFRVVAREGDESSGG
jgi:hypothetical protein